MCLAPKMPDVKVPVPAATAAPASPPAELLTAFEESNKPSEKKDKIASGKKGLRYNPEDTIQVADAKKGSGLQMKRN
jgi:hypothetical protein